MCHRLQWLIHLQAHGLRKGDEHPTYTLHRVRHTTLYHLVGKPENVREFDSCQEIYKISEKSPEK